MTETAKAGHQAGKTLTMRDYRFHFFPWWQEPNYRMDAAGVIITDKDTEYFDAIQTAMGKTIDPEQRAWYVATRNTDFASNPERMWQAAQQISAGEGKPK